MIKRRDLIVDLAEDVDELCEGDIGLKLGKLWVVGGKCDGLCLVSNDTRYPSPKTPSLPRSDRKALAAPILPPGGDNILECKFEQAIICRIDGIR